MTTTLRPKLVLPGAAAALAFYRDVLDATEVVRYTAGDTVIFAELDVLGTRVTVKDPDDSDPVPVPGPILDVQTDEPDALAARLLEAGATVVFAMADQPFGGRWGRVRDPYGVQWLLQSPQQMSPAEIQAEIDRQVGSDPS
jgi:PhnB protein